jgi:hypothetical protein
MKKLMIMACAVAIAAVAQATTYNWSSGSTLYTWDSADPDWPTVAAGTTAYFVFAAEYAQSALVSDFNAGTVDYTKLGRAGNGALNADAMVGNTSATGDYTSNQSAYFVVFDDGKMFVSGAKMATYDEFTGTGEATFGYDQVEGVWTGDAYDAKAGYVGGGWYGASAVPEPTSSLLMLLGVAGLALRRKRA